MRWPIILFALNLCSTAVFADERYLCEARWSHGVFPGKNPDLWRDIGIIPEDQYFIENEKDGARVKIVGKHSILSNRYNCDRFLGGALKCLNGQFHFNPSKLLFTHQHDYGDWYSFSAGDCKAL